MTENENMDDKRSRILKAALEVIAENGFHNSPTSFIAKRAGVSVGLIYRYFENKEQLIEEVYRIEDENRITSYNVCYTKLLRTLEKPESIESLLEMRGCLC